MFRLSWLSRGAVTLAMCMALTPAVFSLGPLIESRFFPVVRLTELTVRRVDSAGLVYEVAFDKIRFCTFIEMAWFWNGVQLEVEYRPDLEIPVRPPTRLVGAHRSGPWRVLGIATLEDTRAYAIHRCHPLWTTVTSFIER